ncbi:tonB-system energizer ExbB [Methylovirgula sp. HY1]|uniref:tonB-system energizer ExbB n=1 Tax=Methylovirgula sp. HY1 TaxID=2822761 RepID=UPI001C796887|nr:tonB-system energizer ExbB [Methylovirgula sp. HY1]QXX74986.1 Biopolymer transport protein ExbB [Methylovirgula sp. HY1]
MNAYQSCFVRRLALRAILAAMLCSGLGFATSPSHAEDMTPAAQAPIAAAPEKAAPANVAPVKPALAAPTPAAPAPDPSAAAPTKDAAADPSVSARLLPHELSPWGMFLSADIIVKVVMVGLALASVTTWTVWLAKSIELFSARRRAVRQLGMLAGADSLAGAQSQFAGAKGAVAQMVAAAAGELARSNDLSAEGIKERAAALIARIEARAGRQMNRGTGALATIGATAPFIGLFGTVWGIMNSFIGISKTNTTNLAVVAPGIAEALLATAIGLVAAIPAVMIYNIFARSIASYRAALGDAAAEILRHLSRDLDRAMMEAAADEGEWGVVGMRQSAE